MAETETSSGLRAARAGGAGALRDSFEGRAVRGEALIGGVSMIRGSFNGPASVSALPAPSVQAEAARVVARLQAFGEDAGVEVGTLIAEAAEGGLGRSSLRPLFNFVNINEVDSLALMGAEGPIEQVHRLRVIRTDPL